MTALASVVLAGVLLYLALGRDCEPKLLLPLGFGLLMGSVPTVFGRNGLTPAFVAGWEGPAAPLDYLYLGVRSGFYAPLLFLGLGALTDFSAILARPRLLGAAFGAQVGVLVAFGLALVLGFDPREAACAAPTGVAEAPTALFGGASLAPAMAVPGALAAYLWAALAPAIQPAIMRLCTTADDRRIRMSPGRVASRLEKTLFPLGAFAVVGLVAPPIAPLAGPFLLGNLLRESGVCDGLSHTLRTALVDVVMVLFGLGLGLGAATGGLWSLRTVAVVVAAGAGFVAATAAGVLSLRILNRFCSEPANPLVGAAAVSPLADSARLVQWVGSREEPTNYLLAPARGVAAAGLLGAGVVAGFLWSLFGA
jgi:oxaloacetate decarboxylase beta subunit